jgi:hypothetical protein
MATDQTSASVAAMVGECLSLLCVAAFYGPPVVFLMAPCLFRALILIGPFAALVTLVVALLAAAALVAGIGALLATPYLILRRRRAVDTPVARPAAVRMPVDLRRVAA